MAGENKEKQRAKEQVQRFLHGTPVWESNNPQGLIDARNRSKPAQGDNKNNQQS